MFQNLINELEFFQDKNKAKILQRFFKTGVGEYGEGDIFLGITVPILRKLAKKYKDLSVDDLEKLLQSNIHEQRFLALCIIRLNYEEGKTEKKYFFELSLKNISSINNWDLVDTFVPYVIGDFLKKNGNISLLYEYVKSQNLWIKRIAIMSTFAFIKANSFDDTIKICELLLADKHDLIQKACGWMLREVGKRDEKILINFLEKYHKIMPRTMLRYSLEKLDKEKKDYFMGRR
ncbi:DNA alkylation repair protein [Candidatus Gracilibacteria bacterium]|nr:DNA alkylation repair protein [Candidatus Gracilibacteria bacterium]NUJ99048.1 DNA alkylation repair protein [Candidatus Gracilibacteria bacterium]